MLPAHYGDIMGCETSCTVAAAGWPLAYVRDYPGMSIGHRATLFDAAAGANRFDWPPFLLNILFWAGLAWLIGLVKRKGLG